MIDSYTENIVVVSLQSRSATAVNLSPVQECIDTEEATHSDHTTDCQSQQPAVVKVHL